MSNVFAPAAFAAPVIPQFTDDHQDALREMFVLLVRRARRNRVRRRYYDYKATLKDLGISIPPQLTSVETVVGWPAKGVDHLVRRTRLEGFTRLDGSTAELGLDDLWTANHMESLVPQAHTSAAVNSPAFVFVTAGLVDEGEPEVLTTFGSAEWATGVYDARRRALKAALQVTATELDGRVSDLTMYLPNMVIRARFDGTAWDVTQVLHDLGVPVEPLVYRPALDRPFGSSRISRAVMALTDSAIRTLLRTEVSAEFYSAPQRYALGADDEAFEDDEGNPIPGWTTMLGRLLTITRDENGDIPTVGQFAQQSMEPHLAQFRQLASAIASEFSMTPRSFGIQQDNPESADAIAAASEDLVMDAITWTDSLGPAWKRTAVNMLRMLDDSPAARKAYAGIRPRWANPARPSPVSSAAVFGQLAANIPDLGETEVGLELAGLTPDQIERVQSDRMRNRGGSSLNQLLAAASVRQATEVQAGATP